MFQDRAKMKNITLSDIAIKIVFFFGLAAAIFHIFVSATGILEAYKMRATHLMFLLPIAFLVYPMCKKGRFSKVTMIDFAWFATTFVALLYVSQLSYSRLIARIPFVTSLTMLDYVVAVFLLVAVLEATRRVAGMGMVSICLVALAYAFFGVLLSGKLRHTGTTIQRMAEQMSLSTNGIFGSTVAASATFIFMFTLFGEFLNFSGAGQFFIDLAFAATGKAKGGPAKMAVVASALMGTISGSSTANVTSTGSYTIPLMKKTGYRNDFAGAVEASASTGGQILPPVMGAASFLLAEYVGISYISLCIAAAIPAALYFIAIFIAVHFEAVRTGLEGVSDTEDRPSWKWLLLHKGYLAIPLVTIIVTLVAGMSAYRAALYAILAIVIILAVEKRGKINFKGIVYALAKGGRSAIMIAVTCAAAGIVIGVSNETGIGVKFASIIIGIGNENIYFILPLVMIAAIVLGMGLPTSAAYIMVATIAVPALISMGCNVMASHLFALYFGVFSGITPPVAISAYAAASLADSKPMKTGWMAVGLCLPAFIIAYALIFNPALILQGNIVDTIWLIIVTLIGVVAIAGGVIGCIFKPIKIWNRFILVIVAIIMTITPNIIITLACMAAIIAFFIYNKRASVGWKPIKGDMIRSEN